jgi:disulfide bond formation protein DsbB
MCYFSHLFSWVGSLIYSGVIGYAPCDLCWYQRIFSYPSVFMLGMAMVRRGTRLSIVIMLHHWRHYIDLSQLHLPGGTSILLSCRRRIAKTYVLNLHHHPYDDAHGIALVTSSAIQKKFTLQ